MEPLLEALISVMSPLSLSLIFGGVFVGIVIGALPGLSATLGVAILLPITYYLSPANGLIFLLGIYTGGIYGGSIAAILLNIPGCPASLMTTLDGYPMAKRGEGGRAIGLATVASFIGGSVGIMALIFISPLLASAALSFGPPEYGMLAVFGLSAIVVVVAKSMIKGFIAAMIGLLLATVGMDPIVSVPRFTYGSPELLGGISYIPVVIGIFGMREVFVQALDRRSSVSEGLSKVGRVIPTRHDMGVMLRNIFHPCWIGTLVGALPGAGGSIASILSYNRAASTAKNPERFGTGITEGIVASEAANNAAVGGAMVPLLTLGIPGSSVTAVLLGAMLIHNITPGPMLYSSHPTLVYCIFLGMALANFAMLILGLICAKFSPRIINLPRSVLLPTIAILCTVGAYSMNSSFFDVGLMLICGVGGFLLWEIGIGPGPLILGLILGPIAEANVRGSLELSDGNPIIFVSSPICAIIFILTLLLLFSPLLRKCWQTRKNRGKEKP